MEQGDAGQAGAGTESGAPRDGAEQHGEYSKEEKGTNKGGCAKENGKANQWLRQGAGQVTSATVRHRTPTH